LAASEPQHYKAFLSYSHRDREWARWLHRALERYRLPKSLRNGGLPPRLAPIFRDRDELPTASSLSAAVNTALDQSESLIVICSPAAAESRWVNEEIRAFRRLGRGDRVFCFIVAGEPNSGDDHECFPAALTDRSDADGSRPEPVAADARPQGDGRRNAMLKLVAGLLGVGFDALKNRDQRRTNQRLLAMTATSLFIATVTIALAVTATVARNDAEFRRAQAEGLIDYMLGDLHERMREIGRLDIYESVGDKALEYFSALRDEDLSTRALSQRAKSLRQIGEVRMDQGDLAAALEAYEESLLITTRLAAEAPNDAETQIGHANSHFYVGHIHWLRGDLPSAAEHFEAVLPIVNRVVDAHPEHAEYLLEKAFAYSNLGRVQELSGEYEQALTAYETVMEVNRHLVELDADNPEFQVELGFAHQNIGILATRLGRLQEAAAHFREDLAIKTRVLATNPEHTIWRSYVAVSQYFLGQLLISAGELEEAQDLLSASLQTMEVLAEIDPDRKEWVFRRARTQRELARLSARFGDPAASDAYLESSIRDLRALVALDEANALWRRDLARSLLVAADIHERRQQHDRASAYLERAETHLAALVDLEPSTSQDTWAVRIHADICRALLAADQDSGMAESAARAALENIEDNFKGTADPRILELKSEALSRLGREEEADRIRVQLRAMGFESSMR
jgi:tetratricopeptide (TPR) repeat protein